MKLFEDRFNFHSLEDVDDVLRSAAERHVELLKDAPHMLEIEFLDEPDPQQRFFRVGTDPRRMVQPVPIAFLKE